MSFKVLALLLWLSCASAGRHQKQKWIVLEDDKSPEDCEKPDSDNLKSSEETLYPERVGSVPGIPGVDYPNFSEIPQTKFSCADQDYVPGFYADLDTHCQVFHVCYEHRRESFLCPTGTIFNQPILACDYWYSVNCSLSPYYLDVNLLTEEPKDFDGLGGIDELVAGLLIKDLFKRTEPYKKPETTTYKLTTEHFSTTEEPEAKEESKGEDREFRSYFAELEEKEVFGKPKYTTPSSENDELSPSQERAEVYAVAALLKELLPVKSQVSLIGALKPEVVEPQIKDEVATDKPVVTEARRLVKPVLRQQIKPKVQPHKVLNFPAVRVIPEVGVKARGTPIRQATAKPVTAYKPTASVSAKSQPISLLTRKQMALNYAKLLKLKKLQVSFV